MGDHGGRPPRGERRGDKDRGVCASALSGPPVKRRGTPASSGKRSRRTPKRKEGPRVTPHEGSAAVAIGIDAAVVANHHIIVRRPEAGRPVSAYNF